MTLAKLAVALGLDARGYHRGLIGAQAAAGRFDRSVGRLGRGLQGATSRLAAFGKRALFVGTIALAALVAGLGGVVNAAVEWEDAFAGVRKTVEATDSQLAPLETGLRRMATEIPVAAGELAKIAEQAGALGIATANIEEFTRVTALIGVTTNVSSEMAATALGQLSNVLGLTQKDYERFASALVDLGNKGASTEDQILGIASRAGAAAKLIGLSKAATLGWASAVANLGIEVEAGGSSLQTFFLKVTQIAGIGGTGLAKLAKTAGLTGAKFKKLFEKDAGAALVAFLRGLAKLDKAQRVLALKELKLGDIRLTRTILGLADSLEKNLVPQLRIADKAWAKNTALAEEARKRFETTKSQLQLLKNNVSELAITIGGALLPVINPIVKGITEWLQQNHLLVEVIGVKLRWALIGAANFIGAVVRGVTGWVEANRPLIDSIGSFVSQTLSGLVSFVMDKVVPALVGEGGIIPSLLRFGDTILRYVIPKVAAFVSNLTDKVIPSVMAVAGPVIGGLLEAFGGIVTALFGGGRGSRTGGPRKKGLIPALGDFAAALWNNGNSGLAKAVKAIGTALGKIFEVVGWIIDRFTDLVEWITSNREVMWRLNAVFDTIGETIRIAVALVGGLISKLGELVAWVRAHTNDLVLLFKILTLNPTAGTDLINRFKGQQHGGPVFAGQPYLVGEKRPEVFVPSTNGRIVPSDGYGRHGGGDVTVNVQGLLHAKTADDIARTLRRYGSLGLLPVGG